MTRPSWESEGIERRRRRRARLFGLLILAGWLAARNGRAQIGSDDVPQGRIIPPQEEIQNDMDRSRLRLGPLRILPSFTIPNAGYDNNVFATNTNPVSDWTFTVSAGARFLVPLGSKFYLLLDAFPHYTWYDKLSDRRRFGGLYEGSFFAFFNRMTIQMRASDREDYVFYSSEVSSQALERLRSASGTLELDLTRSFSLFGSGDYARVRWNQIGGPPTQNVQLSRNDRDDKGGRVGIRYKISEDWNVAALVERTWSAFELEPELRDNRSTAYLGSIFYSRPRLFVNVAGGYRVGRADKGSSYPDFETPSGSFYVSFFPIPRIELLGYGRRRVIYSITVTNPYFFENRVGGGANIELFDRVLLRGFAQVGPNDYPVLQEFQGNLVKRTDHVRVYGGGLSIKLPANAVLTALTSRQIHDSTIPEESTHFTRFTLFVSFSGEYSR